MGNAATAKKGNEIESAQRAAALLAEAFLGRPVQAREPGAVAAPTPLSLDSFAGLLSRLHPLLRWASRSKRVN
uniref:Uncharacterized protein n=1 Tax=Sphaerodactylus townsendi TaxID=933632 RepID=A0ACB8F3T1_9SAUR